MAYQVIDLGTSADDGTGDSLRAGGDKVNDNFSEVYTLLGTGSTLTTGISADGSVVTLTAPLVGTSMSPSSSDGATLGTTALEWSDLYLADGSIIYFGDDQDTTLTHTDGSGLTLNSTNKLMFNDASQFIQGVSATVLDIAATDEIELTATLIDVVGNLAVSGTLAQADTVTMATNKKIQFRDTAIHISSTADGDLSIAADDEVDITSTLIDINGNVDISGTALITGVATHGDDVVSDTDSTDDLGTTGVRWANLYVDAITATDQITATGFTGTLDGILGSGAAAAATTTTLASTTITASGIIKTDDTTAATSTTDGSLQTDGGLSVAADAVIGDDLILLSDAAVLSFGANSEIALTHVHDTGLLLTDSGGSPTLQLHNASEAVSSDGSKLILTSNGVAFSLPTADGSSDQVLSTDGSGTLSFASAAAAATYLPSSADGQALGSASLEWSDLFLADGGTVTFGNDQDVTLTHVADTGLLLNAAMEIQFRDSDISIGSTADGDLSIAANDEIDITSTLIDVNGNLDVSGTALITGVTTHGDDVVSDTDSTDDLGTTSVRWANLFVDAITATDQITATGFTGTLDGILGSGAAAAATVTTLNTTGAVTFNDAGAAVDFRVEGDTDTHLIFADASGDNIVLGGSIGSQFNSVGGSAKLTVVGSSNSTAVLGNTIAAIQIVNTDTTANNTAGLHFSRADTDNTPNYAGSSIVAQFTETQVTGQYPMTDLNFLTSTAANAAPSLKMTLSATGNLDVLGSITANNFAGRNILYNGAMNVAQRSASETGLGAASGYFTLDRWQGATGATAGRYTMAQIADGPAGFANCLKLSCTTADTSIAAGEFLTIAQTLEGQDLQQIKKGTASAEQLTLSFWVKGNASATYVAELYDIDNTRQVAKTFAVTTSWAKITLTYPADTSDPFDADKDGSLKLFIWLHAGATYTGGTLNSSAWADVTAANRAVGISSFFDATSRTFFMTGVQLERGPVATEFEFVPYGIEKETCKRYFYRLGGAVNALFEKGRADGGGYDGANIFHNPEMRAAPTIAKTGTFAVSNVGQPAWTTVTATTGYYQAQISANGAYNWYSNDAAHYVSFDAEL